MTKFLWRLTIIAAIGWTGYIVAHAGWTYLATRDAIDSAVREAASRYRNPLTTGRFTDTMLDEVRDLVVQVAGQSGVPVQARNVAVRASLTGISATVHYLYPVVTLQGMGFAVPLSFSVGAGVQS